MTGGFEFELAKDLCAQLGVGKVRIVNVDFDALQAGKTKDFDLALSQITITDARKKNEDFSDSYFSSDQGIMVNKGTQVPDLAAAKKLKWGVQTGTTSEIFLNDKVKPDSAAEELRPDDRDVHRAEGQAHRRGAARHRDRARAGADQNAEVVAQFKTGEVYGALLPKGSANLALVNTAFAKLKANGTLDALVHRSGWCRSSRATRPRCRTSAFPEQPEGTGQRGEMSTVDEVTGAGGTSPARRHHRAAPTSPSHWRSSRAQPFTIIPALIAFPLAGVAERRIWASDGARRRNRSPLAAGSPRSGSRSD